MSTEPATDDARRRIAERVVGRERELELALAAVEAGRDLVLEGPPGTSKTTMLQAITSEWGIPLILVEGNADLSPTKLIGHHSPVRVLREDYSPENFIAGPLVRAMQDGGFLYIEEFNRAPEDTLNTLLTAMADRRIEIPRVGTIEAAPSFRVIASMNPFDNVGTTRLSTSISDRLNRIVVAYQDAAAEEQIVARRSGLTGALASPIAADAVAVTRLTRVHAQLRQGSSVRGAIDLALIADRLLAGRGIVSEEDPRYAAAMLDGMLVALSGRIRVDEASGRTAEDILREIWLHHFHEAEGAAAAPG